MTKFLAVDTSSKYLTVIAVNGDKKVKRYIPDCALNHSVILMDEIDKALNQASLSPKDCDFFAAVTGPGSFTGIRIGISAVKGLALACGKREVGVTSFEMLAYNVNGTSDFLIAINALHGNFYVCGFDSQGKMIIEPCYLSREELLAHNLPVYGFEDSDLPDYTRLDAGECLLPAVLAYKDRPCGGLHALYVRKSQAEENRKC